MPLYTLQKYTDVFVETGTRTGDGVQTALNSGYSKIISIEIYEAHYQSSKNRFKHLPNVKIVKGDSGIILGEVISDINEPMTFWLDAHLKQAEDSEIGVKDYPIIEELSHIKNHPIKNHVILIDDIRCWNSIDESLMLDSVIEYIKTINPNYSIERLDGETPSDILLAIIR